MRFVSCNHWYSGRYICMYVFVSPSVGNNWEWFAEVWIFKRAGWRTQQWVCESLTLHCWHVGFCWLVCGSICTCSVPACTVLSLAQHMDCYHPTCMHVRHTFSVCDWNYVCNYVFTYVQYVCMYVFGWSVAAFPFRCGCRVCMYSLHYLLHASQKDTDSDVLVANCVGTSDKCQVLVNMQLVMQGNPNWPLRPYMYACSAVMYCVRTLLSSC